MSLDLDGIEADAREHLLRCRATEQRMMDPYRKRTVDPGIVPGLCETILRLSAELRRAKGARR